ncbi:hypothetical protein [Streptomyces syringium]|uniref:hypothetical protein n=1 Tax=Streptomyces syringium TaxID=76729 RepID=UPI0037CEF900
MDGLFSWPHRARTTAVAGTFVLVAFAGLALSTAMPVAVQELGGLSLYALAFGGFLAASIVGPVVGGGHADRHGPGPALFAGRPTTCAASCSSAPAGPRSTPRTPGPDTTRAPSPSSSRSPRPWPGAPACSPAGSPP